MEVREARDVLALTPSAQTYLGFLFYQICIYTLRNNPELVFSQIAQFIISGLTSKELSNWNEFIDLIF